MVALCTRHKIFAAAVLIFLAAGITLGSDSSTAKKIYMITDLEGVDGIFDSELQCIPFQSPRFEESRKLLTGEVNAAVDGLFEGGATDVVVWDGHDSGRTLSTLDIDARVRLLQGRPVSPTLELDSSYAAVVFIGQHAMAGAEKGMLSHSYSSDTIQNIWVNNKPVGEIGGRVMLAGAFGVPVIMLSGDTAACREIHDLVPNADCAEVKQGVSRTAGFSLSHVAACGLIHRTALDAIRHLGQAEPYTLAGPVEVKVEFTTTGVHAFRSGDGVEQINDRTRVFRGKDILDAWLKYSSF
ncbi:MAG TPA: M55 family metallopeptidase [Terriglobia bacterium]|nr:M55 family metallopeptidase [Terriglobia bacterium]